MKYSLIIFTLLTSFLLKSETVDVYILSGQSNMQGIGKLQNLPQTYIKPRKNCFFWNGKEFEQLVPGKTKTSARKGDFGPEMGFSYIMQQMNPSRKIYIIKHYASGQPLHFGWNGNKWAGNTPAPNQWNFYPGEKQNDPKMGLHYKNLKKIFTKALSSLDKSGVKYQVKGIVWMQGEQDTKNPKSAVEYATCLKQFRTILEADLKTPNLPFVFGQVCPYTPARKRFTNRMELRQSQANAHYNSGHSDAISGVFMIPTEGMPLLADTVHYNATGHIMLGQEMGLAMLEMQQELKPKLKKNPVDKPSKQKPQATPNKVTKLWPNGNPGGWIQEKPEESATRGGVTRIKNINIPTITQFNPKIVTKGVGVIICPGGGYAIEAIDKEGTEIAEYLSTKGYHAFVLKYRLPQKGDLRYVPALQDAQRAISIVRSKASELGLTKVGIMGFSAGGHLSATTSTHAQNRVYKPVDEIDKISCAPDFVGLIYPAYLLKKKKSQELAPEVEVTKNTAPTFLLQTSDDGIPVENSLFYYLVLKKHKVSSQLHIYPKGPHGYGLRCSDKAVGIWPELFVKWLEETVK